MSFDCPWNDISSSEFRKSALGKENQITVIWIPDLLIYASSRKCNVNSSSKWTSLISNSIIPRYKQGRLPEDQDAELFTLQEYCIQPNYPEMTSANHILSVAPSIHITTAYDNNSNRRLIVDGLKRAIGIQQLINEDSPIPESIIMECYGKIVRCIFPIEFMHVR